VLTYGQLFVFKYGLCLIFYHLQFIGQLFVFQLWPLLIFYHLFSIFLGKYQMQFQLGA